ncbi:hypothetical protein [Corallococcus sp. AB049A]|uniref:hypothetical protein n=1 Tax=Corallococcus sp. AB049A TaxID=2316721 RepID=UPI0011C36653|nr:hypothetical protein [Corallococcus sp. AB049A]
MRFVQIVWIFVGAYLGPLVMVSLLRLWPERWLRSRDVLEIPLGQEASLPGIAVFWLLSLGLGAVAAVWAWRWLFERRKGVGAHVEPVCSVRPAPRLALAMKWQLRLMPLVLLLASCDESEGFFRTVEVDAPIYSECVEAALADSAGGRQSSAGSGRWSLSNGSTENRREELTVVLRDENGKARLDVFAQSLVPSDGRFTPGELEVVRAETHRIMQAILVRCVKADVQQKLSCRAKVKNFKGQDACAPL